jgi:hypothetical protein
MKSLNSWEIAEEFYNNNINKIVEDCLDEAEKAELDVQYEYSQVVIWSDIAYGLCFQNSDMNGDNLNCANFDNAGADDGFLNLVEHIIKKYPELHAKNEVHDEYFAKEAAAEVAQAIFEKKKIASILKSFSENEER